ncbi:DUF418 domain-containing protein [Streptomyces tauricus]|uniref:DUF418 domain-containing protein n=1 Tax=Streptomyces tauricus TaxID=68274 RepID=UPI0022443215|nr:DUF418 domain-containing protein [Streptomyces tauricus]MCW8103592.1 DUF418 domain-containing protein [Streptomyces tauricus]
MTLPEYIGTVFSAHYRRTPSVGHPQASRGSRIEEIDALRGFALFGIIIVNAPVIAGVDNPSTGADGTLADQIAVWLVTIFFSAKFYLLFAFLFGYSFTIQVPALTRNRDPTVLRFRRRLVGIFLLGLAHAVLFYPGDILITYSVLGSGLLILRAISIRCAIRTAAYLIVFLTVTFLSVGTYVLSLDQIPPDSAQILTAEATEAYLGSPYSVISMNGELYLRNLGSAAVYSLNVFSAFLVGFAAGRCGLFLNPSSGSRTADRVFLIGALIGVPGAIFVAACTYGSYGRDLYYIGQAVSVLTSPALSATYVCFVIRLRHTRYGGSILRTLGSAGKMSLTNYLAQSITLCVIFTGYGFGLYGKVGPAALCVGCFLFYLCQLSYSSWIMSRTRYGPAEAILRRITLGHKEFNLVRKSRNPASSAK